MKQMKPYTNIIIKVKFFFENWTVLLDEIYVTRSHCSNHETNNIFSVKTVNNLFEKDKFQTKQSLM